MPAMASDCIFIVLLSFQSMITHIALYRFKAETGKADIDRVLSEVRSLRSKVPGLADIRCGENFSKWNEGYTHAIVVLAEGRDALDAYRNHPDHKAIAEWFDKSEEKSIGIDFES